MRFARIISLFLMFVLLLSFAGCSDNSSESDKLNIVCTIFPQYDVVRSITKNVDDVDITLLIGAGQESHDYDPSSKDIAKIHGCDIFVYTGGESDSWVIDILESVDTEGKTVISLFDVLGNLIEHEDNDIDFSAKHEHSEEHGAVDNVEYDEHVWTSPKNAMTISDKIFEVMCDRMPDNIDLFRENYNELKNELVSVDISFRDIVNGSQNPTIVVADRFPLLYFCKDYGIKYYAAFSGCSASTEPSSKTVQFLIEKVKNDGISAVFKMDMSTGNVATTVSEATDVPILTFYSCHTISATDFESGVTYVDLMKRNVESLKNALNK